MAEKDIKDEPNHVTVFTNIPRFPVVDDPTGTPTDGYMDTDDIRSIANTEISIAITALGSPLGNVSSSGAVTAGHLAVWIDADTIEDGGAVPTPGTGTVTTTGAVVAGHYAKFIDATHIEDGGTIAGGRTITNTTVSYVALTTDDLIICNKATSMSVSLLAATGSGRKVSVASIGVGVVTLQIAGGVGTINNAATMVLNQWDTANLVDISSGMWLFEKYG